MRYLAPCPGLCLRLGVMLLVAAGCAPAPRDLDRALPEDTLLWARFDRVDTIEEALDRQGLVDLVVAELDEPETRDQIRDELGLTVSDDPRADVHAILADVERLDITLHPVAGEDIADEVRVFMNLEVRDEAAAAAFEETVGRQAEETRTWDGTPVHVIGGDEHPFFVLRDGARLMAADDPDLLRAMRARLVDTPDPGLAGNEFYRSCRGDGDHDVQIYISPAFQAQADGLFDAATMGGAPAMQPLLEKYGSQAAWIAADYLLTRVVARATYEKGSALMPFTDCPSGRSRLLDRLPAGTYAAEVALVHDGARKATLFKDLYRDMLATAAEGEAMDPMMTAPIEMLEGTLGFTLEDVMGPLAEVAIAGVPDAGVVLLLRGHDDAAAEALHGLIGSSAILNFLTEGEPREVSGCTLRTFGSPMDDQDRVFALGLRGDTVMLVMAARTVEGLEAFVAGMQDGGLAGSAAAPAKSQLGRDGYAWFMLDMAGLAAEWEISMDEACEDLPPVLATRLKSLVVGGHAVVGSPGTYEAVFEMTGP